MLNSVEKVRVLEVFLISRKHHFVLIISVTTALIILLLDLTVLDVLRSATVRIENLSDIAIIRIDIWQENDPVPVTTFTNIPATSVASSRSSLKPGKISWIGISFADGRTTKDSLGMVSGEEIGEVIIQIDNRSTKHFYYGQPPRRYVLHIIIIAIVLIPLLFYVTKVAHRYHRQKKGLCLGCGYDLRASFDLGCPECGWKRQGASSQTEIKEK